MKATIAEIAGWLGTAVPAHPEREVTSLLTDSRSLTQAAGTLFFAIRTAAGDGHRYIRDLYERGVRDFVVNAVPREMAGAVDAEFIVVADTVAALQRVARCPAWFAGTVVAITGSRGKTTLKEWIFQLLEPLRGIVRSPRSYNSQIGVPLSMWEIAPDTEMAVIEAGVSRPGEMQALAGTICPDTVIITNIGAEHDEGFADRRQKAAEKAVLAAAPSVRTVIYDADEPLVADAVRRGPATRRLLGWSRTDPGAPLYIGEVAVTADGPALRYLSRTPGGAAVEGEFVLPGDSAADIGNGAAALALLLTEGYGSGEIRAMSLRLRPTGTRLNVSDGVNGCSVIYDSYTSDFSSLGPAVDFMKRRADGRTPTLIVSDLRHEGITGAGDAAAIAGLVRDAGIRRFIGIGPKLTASRGLFGADALFFDSTDSFMDSMSTSDFQNEIVLLKGAPEFDFGRILQLLEARTHETVLEVNLDSIVRNYNYFRSALPAGTGLIAMVKASGYGAGSYEIAKTMQDCGAAYLAVAVLDEGIDLRHAGITMPVMVMNPKVVNYKSMFAYRLEPEIYSFGMLSDVIREARKNGVAGYPIHIKLDTGMHRMGFTGEELPALMDMLAASGEVRASSVFSHLATADCPDMDDYTRLQLGRFEEYTSYMLGRYRHPIKRHILNSAGILRFPEHHYDMARLGIGLYGVNTLPPEMEKPLAVVSALRTVIIAIREWPAGETVGYGRRGRLGRRSRIATIPVGYADGMNRHFGCGAVSVMVNGREAPTVGNICMDACMIDVTGIDCAVGDAVEIFGPSAPVGRLADVLGTIPYEVLTSVSPRVKRVYYRE